MSNLAKDKDELEKQKMRLENVVVILDVIKKVVFIEYINSPAFKLLQQGMAMRVASHIRNDL